MRSSERKPVTKAWNKRSECWIDIAQHHEDYGLQNTLLTYKEELQSIPKATRERNIQLWVKDKKKGKNPLCAKFWC